MTTASSARARHFAELLVGWPSVTNTADEARFATRLRDELGTWPCFRRDPAALALAPAPGRFDRASVLALVRGSGPQTVLLVGHFDTVSVEDYAELAPLAGQPEALRAALIARLDASGDDALALEDLSSGSFAPGRGMLDMKSGLAAGLAALEAFAAQDARVGNLLLIACPDEEETSAGMRSVAAMLPDFLTQNGLHARLAINLDAICDNGDGAAGQVVAMGCIGKLLLSALVVGKPAHACYPLDGVNAGYLAAELVAEMEHAPELGEISGGHLVSPPAVLGLRDLKPQYDVTLPARAWCFWNVLMHRRRPADVLAAGHSIARRAVDRAAARMAERARSMGGGAAPGAAWNDIPILAFGALAAEAGRRSPGFGADLAAFAAGLSGREDLDLPSRSREITEFAWRRSGRGGPAVVLCIGATPYPAIAWREDAALEAAIDAAVAEIAARREVALSLHPFFPAIADMSFIGPLDASDLATFAAETPLWGSSVTWPGDPGAGIPVINVGPWGRDYHHWLERAHASYSFDVLPELVACIAAKVLGPRAP